MLWCKLLSLLLITVVQCEIDEVYVLFSTHVDLGYSQPDWNPVYNRTDIYGTKMSDVINRYFNEHFETAISTAEAVDYKWMTQSWLVNAYRHCNETIINSAGGATQELKCPNATALKRFEDAVSKGKLSWHALPFNAEPELYDPWLFEAALNLTFREDAHFGHAKRQTLSQRDVPGLTRAIIPMLSKAGVRAISVGENNAQAPLFVPPIFVWKDLESGTEVLSLFHAGGYGGEEPAPTPYPTPVPDSFNNNFNNNFNGARMLTKEKLQKHEHGGVEDRDPLQYVVRSDCVEVPSAGAALCYAWKMDNTGPHNVTEVKAVYEQVLHPSLPPTLSPLSLLTHLPQPPSLASPLLPPTLQVRALYPAASSVHSSDAFDDFVDRVWPHRGSLPVVTAEIGDTWIYGASTDCRKVAAFRAISRARLACSGADDAEGAEGTRSARGEGKAQALQARELPSCGCTVREMRNFERLLMVGGEHTWGSDGGGIRNQAWTRSGLQLKLLSNDSSSHDFHLVSGHSCND
jgi:hypothetical protein